MSCTARHKSQCGNPAVVEATCERVEGARFLGPRQAYGASGVGVQLKHWSCLCLFHESGEILYDSDDSHRLDDLRQFKQQYQVAAARLAYPHASILENSLAGGEIELTVQLSGGYST
jgi:hypothetical protein